MSEEHYRTLGISPDASRAEIEAAYKQRVKETHPDLNDDPNAADEFQRVKEARDALLGSGSTVGASGGATTSGGGARGGSTGDAAGRSRSGGSRRDTSTRTEEPTGDRTEGRGRSAAGSASSRSSGSASQGEDGRTRNSRGETSRTDAAGAGSPGGSGRNATGAAGAGSGGGRSGANRSGREASAGTAGQTRDYPRYRSVIEEPTGGRAAAYDRVVPQRSTPRPAGGTSRGGTSRGGTTGGGTTRQTPGVASGLLTFPAVLVKQFVYSLMWGIVGVPLAVLYLYGVRGLYYGGMATTSALAMLLGAVGVSFVKVRIGIVMSGAATVGLAYFALVWHPDPSWLEVAIAFHLVPLYVLTALVAEYA